MPKHIGIAAVSVEGALLCARIIQAEAEKLDPTRRPELTVHFLPFDRYLQAASRDDWPAVGVLLVESIAHLKAAGADFAIIPANTAHYAFEHVARSAPLPVLNLIDAAADECRRRAFTKVGILGVKWTMAGGLYDAPMRTRGVEPLIPDDPAQDAIHRIVFEELFANDVRPESTSLLLAIVRALRAAGCQAVILACTELPMALNDDNCGIPALDTTRLIAELALAHSQT
jgi:aspartate racemase